MEDVWDEQWDSGNAHRRRMRMFNARERGTHTKQEWQALKDFCQNQCVRCGSLHRIQKDHIIPVYQDGSDGIENLQPLCQKCNCGKGPEGIDFRPSNWRDCLVASNA